MPELREAIARYASACTRRSVPSASPSPSSGVNALMLAMQALAGAGDEVVAVVPVWPNLTAQPQILGARVTRVPLKVEQGAWKLDLDAARRRDAGHARAARQRAQQPDRLDAGARRAAGAARALPPHRHLDHRRRGLRAALLPRRCALCPSFLDIATPDDRLVVVHSFSKSFLMTGWRLGWMVAPAALIEAMGKLIEFNTSCAPVFVQRSGLAELARATSSCPAWWRA